MRYLLVLTALLLPLTADAQDRSRRHRPSTTPRAAATAPHPDAASALLPAGSQRLRLPSESRSSWPRWQQRHESRHWRFHHRSAPFFGGGYYATPYFGYYPPDIAAEAAQYEVEPEPAGMLTTGLLRLDITPATDLQYYIDGMFIGSSSDLGTEFAVNAGARRIEIRAAGYKPVIFDARFVPGGMVTRRGALEPLHDASTLPRATGNRTVYVIPGCYMGNARPDPEALPKGCDIKRLVTRGGS